MQYGLWKKGLVVGIIGFVIGASCLPSIAATDDQQNEIGTVIEGGTNTEKMTNARISAASACILLNQFHDG